MHWDLVCNRRDHTSLFFFNSGGFIKATEAPELQLDTRWRYTCEFLHWPQLHGFIALNTQLVQMGTFHWFCSYTLCQSKLYNPAALTDPNTPSCTLTTKSHSTKPEHWLCSRGPIYKCLTTDVIRLGKYFVYCVLASCVAAVSYVTLCFRVREVYSFCWPLALLFFWEKWGFSWCCLISWQGVESQRLNMWSVG